MVMQGRIYGEVGFKTAVKHTRITSPTSMRIELQGITDAVEHGLKERPAA